MDAECTAAKSITTPTKYFLYGRKWNYVWTHYKPYELYLGSMGISIQLELDWQFDMPVPSNLESSDYVRNVLQATIYAVQPRGPTFDLCKFFHTLIPPWSGSSPNFIFTKP